METTSQQFAHAAQFSEARDLIALSQRILLVSHRRPDGDTLGATVALHSALLKMGKTPVAACIDAISPRLTFVSELLTPPHEFVREFDLNTFDLIIISDAGASHMTGFQEKYSDFLSKRVPIINIDHHGSNDNYGTINIVDPKASSATIMVWRFLKFLGMEITRPMAKALLAGIYNDTGGMMHSNTTRETYEAAAELCAKGVSIDEVVRPLFKDSSFSQLKLWGFILENMHRNEKDVVSSVVTEGDLKIIGAHSGDTGGIIDLMNTVPEGVFTLLLAEDEGVVKGSLRTRRDDVNVSDIAGQFGGGGHAKASGFRINGRLEREVKWKIVPA